MTGHRETTLRLALGLLLAAALLSALPARAAAPLSAQHKKWLEQDVVYIISDDEKKLFRSLPTDADRDKFIDRFWLTRDPTPGTEENEFKDEHYRRIEHANQFYSSLGGADGWRSDRGKIYIILGQPKTVAHHAGGNDLYPSELWFYSNDEPALPPFFYVMFYVRNDIGDYKLYSPYVDGPTKLTRTSGTENNPRGAYQRLLQYNYELARASLTLIPSEPAEPGLPSMSSDGMLMKIINLANDKFHKERIERRARLREDVKVRITFDVPLLEVLVFPMRDPAGESYLHYSLQVPEPQAHMLAQEKDTYLMSFEATVKVLDAQKREIYQATRRASASFGEGDLEFVRGAQLHFDDRIPVIPGEYHLEFILINQVDRAIYRGTEKVRVEPHPVDSLALGTAILVQRCASAASIHEPFVFGGSRCTPLARTESSAGEGSTMVLVYPVYLEPEAAGTTPPLQVEYTLGRLDRGVEPKVIKDTLDRGRFDRFDTLLVGKTLPVGGLPFGAYHAAVRVTDPTTKKSAATTLAFRLGPKPPPSSNVLTPANLLQDELSGEDDYRRGLCAQAQNHTEQATAYFSRALERNPEHRKARIQLAGVYYAERQYEKVSEVLSPLGVSAEVDWETLQKLLASLEMSGHLPEAIETAEKAVSVLEPTAEMYEQLAKLYDRAGNSQRAQQARSEARRLTEQRKQDEDKTKTPPN